MYIRTSVSRKLLAEQMERVNRLLENIQLKLMYQYGDWMIDAYRKADGVYIHRLTGYMGRRGMSDFLCYVESLLMLERKGKEVKQDDQSKSSKEGKESKEEQETSFKKG